MALIAPVSSTTSTLPHSRGEFAVGWKALLACGVGIGLGISPVPTFTTGIFAIALEKQFGWSRGDILSVVLFQTLCFAVLGPLLGRLTDRIGARPVVIASTIGLGLSTAAFALITAEIWTFYLAYAVMTVLAMGTMPPIYARVISLWFDRKRGLALGLALCTTGISGMVLPPYVQGLIDTLGWRAAYIGLGLLPLAIALPCIWFLLPRGAGPASGASPGEDHPREATEGLATAEALRGYRYWLMAIVGFVAGAGLSGLVINFVPLLIDRGFTAAGAAGLFSLFGLFVVVGRLFSGWLLDKFWAPGVGCGFLLLPVIGVSVLASGAGPEAPYVLMIAVILIAMASGGEFDLIAYLSSRFFGRRNFSALYAGQYAIFAMGAGIAPGVMGTVHDRFGSYDPVLYTMAVLFGVGAVALLGLGRYPVFRPAPEQA